MNIIHDIRDRFFERVRTSETVGPILFAVTIGIGAGFAAVLFRRLIDLVEYLFLGQGGALLTPWIGLAYTIPIIGLGGLLVGLITRYFAPETKGHGVPEVMLAVAREGGRIRAGGPLELRPSASSAVTWPWRQDFASAWPVPDFSGQACSRIEGRYWALTRFSAVP
ncbi:MAG: hypothetical protein ACLFTT_17455 [Candidatus Hydrogenedentota bacterium]